MNNYWKPCAEYTKVVDANRCFYAKMAGTYDRTETCVTDRFSQGMLTSDLKYIIHALGKPRDELKVLDACGGSGNVALKLLGWKINVTVVDVSEDLLNILRRKCSKFGYLPGIVCKEIGAFFLEKIDKYDLIVFSSALHHLQDVRSVLRMAYPCLKRGGLVFTIFDPTSQSDRSWVGRKIARVDYLLFKIQKQPKDILPAIRRKFLQARRHVVNRGSEFNANGGGLEKDYGALAEFHAISGINDIELVKYLKGIGYEVLWHKKYVNARHSALRWMLTAIGDRTHFKLLLRK
jgi:ubiquinone/menaquinone biosynthesis C-methylase UbiE